ncbi:extracellular matrix protein 3-like [Panulirus ornatus]|uniref:extracellular matrix protein 3-like n=1 Tax=Panulirus ornatus TaxID=150431 RepID=UPI003A8C505C
MRPRLVSKLLLVVGLLCGAQVTLVTGQDDDDYAWYDYSGDAVGGEDDHLSGYYSEYDDHDEYSDNSLTRGDHDSGPSFSPIAASGTAAPVSPSTHVSHHTTLTRPVVRDSSRSFMPSRVSGFDRSLPPTSPEDAEKDIIPSSTFPRRPSLQGNPLQPILPPGFDGRGSSSGGVRSPQSGVMGSGSPRGSQVAGQFGVRSSGVETSGHATSLDLGADDILPDGDDIENNGDGTGTYDNGEGELGEGSFGASYDDRNLYEDVIEEEDIVLVNRRLEVPYGRVRYLDSENDLKIKVLPGHRCRVTVIETEPGTQRPGKLMPSNFSCAFGRNEVQYTHLGGQHPSEDAVKLLLRYDTRRDTFIIPTTVTVRILYDMQLEVVTKVVPLSVRQLLGVSNAIDGDNTVFAFDDTHHECKLTLLHSHSDLPRYGSVISDAGSPPVGYMVPCQRFLQLGVRYQHKVATSTKLDHIPAVVELYDRTSMTLLKQEYFQYPVRIHPGRDNTAPAVSRESLLLLDVNQFVMTALTPSVVKVDDAETPSERLVFNVTKPLAFGEGLLVSTDDQNLPVASFYQRDVGDLKIVYKPPAEDSSVKRIFEVEFEVLDDEGLASVPFRVMIVVNPKMTMAPLTTKNAGLELFEGQSRRLSSARNLEIADEDNLEDVTLTILDGLRHGRLLLMGAPAGIFSPADLDTGAVVYQHDGTETHTDNLLLRLSDDEHEVDFLFPITIFPEDDEPPVAHVNTGLELRENEESEITAFILSATDVDSDDASISYIMQDPAPRLGKLILRRPRLPPRPENWQFVNNQYERTASSWTQRDITGGHLHYVHQGEHTTATATDRIYFKLADDSEPPNESGTIEMIVKILPVDDIPPELDSNCSLTLMVPEHRLTALAAANLRYTDLDSSDGWVSYRIRPPHNVDVNDPMSPGEIVLTDSPDTVIASFTQSQLNYRKVSYKPPRHEIGIVPRIIQFEFDVEDKAGNSLRGQTFTIFLTPVDNQPPEVHNAGLQMVREHSQAVITTRHLNISDPDTADDHLSYRVVKPPGHGVLMYNTLTLAPGNEFTPRDVANGLITYVNDGKGEVDRDRFELVATDGVHTLPINFFINIEAIDDEPPRLVAGSAGATVRVLEGRETAITPQVLRATDPDSESIRLTFIVYEAPTHGMILLNGVPTSSFTQMSIDNEEVVYRHDGGDIGRSRSTDNFTLILSDMSDEYVYGGNRLEQVLVNVTIEPVDNVAPRVFVDGPIAVVESSKSSISVEHIKVSDADTDDERLTCVITKQPRSGYVEDTAPAPGHERSREGIPVTSFSVRDVLAGHMNYVQSIYTKVEPRDDRFVFYCTDGVNRSPEVTMDIRITPFNDEMPLFTLKEFIVMEGTDLIIEPPVLVATDGDEPRDQLTFTVSRVPQHGRVMRQDPEGLRTVDRFTADDLTASSKIVYSHDDSETTEDDFELLLTDGNPTHEVRKEVRVRIIPEDDETPRLTLNTGLDVDAQEAAVITNKDLMAEDLDSDDRNLTYVIREAPRFGYIELLEQETLAHLQNLTVGMNFTQGDVDDGVIQYRHTGVLGSGTHSGSV